MVYELAIGDRAYSSWSLRGWLLFDAFGIPVNLKTARLYTDEVAQVLKGFYPARTLPALRLAEGLAIGESLAIAEELASRHPDAGLWPADPDARAVARMLAYEMHAGFFALRNHCPMNLRVSYQDCAPPAEVLTDLARLELLWAWAREASGTTGDWLCGTYSAADVSNCYVTGEVTSKGAAAGALGYFSTSSSNKVTLTNCYAACDVGGSASYRYPFAYIYSNYLTATNCLYESGRESNKDNTQSGITAASADELKAAAGTLGDAFRADLSAPINGGYPILRWQYVRDVKEW